MGLGELYLDKLPHEWCEKCQQIQPVWKENYTCAVCFPKRPESAPPLPPTAEPEAGHPEFLKLLDEMRAVHQKKAADYGTRGEDPLANLRASEAFGIPAWVGAVMRCNDKMKRVQSFVKNGELKNESVEDSLLDGAAYFLLALVLFREGKAVEA